MSQLLLISLRSCLLTCQGEVTRMSVIAVLLIVAAVNIVLIVVVAKAWNNCELIQVLL